MTPPSRLAYTFRWEPPDPVDQETVATLTLTEFGGTTELTLDQRPFATRARLGLHERGWPTAWTASRDTCSRHVRVTPAPLLPACGPVPRQDAREHRATTLVERPLRAPEAPIAQAVGALVFRCRREAPPAFAGRSSLPEVRDGFQRVIVVRGDFTGARPWEWRGDPVPERRCRVA